MKTSPLKNKNRILREIKVMEVLSKRKPMSHEDFLKMTNKIKRLDHKIASNNDDKTST